jgi:hypothetical protein
MNNETKIAILNDLFPGLTDNLLSAIRALETAAATLTGIPATSSKTSPAKRKPGRPAKAAPKVAAPVATPAKRKPGRPAKAATPVILVEKRKPGRPKKAVVAAPTPAVTPAKRKPGRPKKVEVANGVHAATA